MKHKPTIFKKNALKTKNIGRMVAADIQSPSTVTYVIEMLLVLDSCIVDKCF